MTPRRLLPLAAAVFFLAVLAAGASAGDPAAKVAGAESEKPKAEKPKDEKPKKVKKKPAAKDKKKKAPQESRYKSRELSESAEHSYRFDARGNPVGGARKKEAQKAMKKSSTPPEEKPEEKPGACTLEAPCPEKGSDADAL